MERSNFVSFLRSCHILDLQVFVYFMRVVLTLRHAFLLNWNADKKISRITGLYGWDWKVHCKRSTMLTSILQFRKRYWIIDSGIKWLAWKNYSIKGNLKYTRNFKFMRSWQDYVLRKNNLVQSFALSPTKVKEHITFGHSLQKYICSLRTDNRYTDIILKHLFV